MPVQPRLKIAAVPEFIIEMDRLENAPKNSQLKKNLYALQEEIERMKDINYRGLNDKALDRDLTGYRSSYIAADPNNIDPETGAHKPSHRLVYEEYRMLSAVYRSLVAFDTRDKVYKKAAAIKRSCESVSIADIVKSPKFDAKVLRNVPAQQRDYIMSKAESHTTLKAQIAPPLLRQQLRTENSQIERASRAQAEALLNAFNTDKSLEDRQFGD